MRNFYQPPYGYPPFQGMPYMQPDYQGYEGFPYPEPQIEQSYIENILRLNKGKIATVYMNFESSQWGSKIFKGIIEAAGKDHIILSDPNSNIRYVLLTVYLDYITFDEEINYYYPYGDSNQRK